MAFEQTKWVWMNGKVVPWSQANVHASAHTLHYGSGVFEGIRCYNTDEGPALFRLDEHLDRLLYSAAVYGMTIPYSKQDLEGAITETITANDFNSCYVRPICFYGTASLAVNPSACPVEVVILAWPWGKYLGEEAVNKGVRLTVSPWTRFHSNMMPTTAKGCGQYVNSILAVRDAHQRGFDEALMMDREGNVAEGSGENLFLIKDGALHTNDEKSSILPGITRDSILKIAEDLGIPVSVGPITKSSLLAADEAFLTGTAVEVSPVGELDGYRIGSVTPGPITRAIQEEFFLAVSGKTERYSHWLTVVDGRLAEAAS